jgi:hypothetical protein
MATRSAAFALLAGLTMAAPSVAFAEAERASSAQVIKTERAPAPTPTNDTSNYAEREASSAQAQEFEGGQTVIVFSGAALVALLLLLILI